jgi:hypothetical protein
MMNLSSMLVVQRNAFSGNIKRYFDVLPCPLVQLLAQTQTLRFGICFPTAVADRSPLAVAVAVAVAVAEEVPPLEKCALNLMLATWLLGRDADPLALEAKLESTTFDCVVVVFTRGVLDDSPVAEFFRDLVEGNCRYKDTVLKEKSVCRLNSKEFAVMHRWKVHNHIWETGKIREGKPLCVEMGTLSLMLNTERQPCGLKSAIYSVLCFFVF